LALLALLALALALLTLLAGAAGLPAVLPVRRAGSLGGPAQSDGGGEGGAGC